MPRVSVVVPIYDVEPFVEDCLQSVQAQTIRDLEVVMVDDGSHDRSADIAGEFVELDRRFRLIRQANGGLGHARNVGVGHSSGEFVTFLDSDDMVPPDAYERMLAALDATGSDFATGDILRFDGRSTWPTGFLRRTFTRDRPATHVTRFRRLLSDRMAQNKLWRREFWERRQMRFPTGVYHEDIPIVLPAHFEARTVDVLHTPVYLYRSRDEGGPSITQRRAEVRVLRDRVAAVEAVLDYLGANGPPGWSALYAERVLAEDLRYHVQAFRWADDDYRAEFVELARGLLARIEPRAIGWQPAIDRLKWHLVDGGHPAELLEVLEFERAHRDALPRRRIAGKWYGDYPFLDDPRLGIPRSVYHLEGERRRNREVDRAVPHPER